MTKKNLFNALISHTHKSRMQNEGVIEPARTQWSSDRSRRLGQTLNGKCKNVSPFSPQPSPNNHYYKNNTPSAASPRRRQSRVFGNKLCKPQSHTSVNSLNYSTYIQCTYSHSSTGIMKMKHYLKEEVQKAKGEKKAKSKQ